MGVAKKILILGASYGSLFGIKAILAGYDVHLICSDASAQAFNDSGAIVRMPIKGQPGLVEVNSKQGPGMLTASSPSGVDPAQFDLAVLAMQEPQYGALGVRELLHAVAKARIPCVSIMNMPPLPYLMRIPGLDLHPCRGAYTEPSVWSAFDPDLLTLCSPDPQAFRPEGDKANVLQVRLATNFKAAEFARPADTSLLHQLAAGIDAARWSIDGVPTELPVKLRLHASLFVPFAKWPMLMTGNYRCIGKTAMRPIKDAVHADIAQSQNVYDWVVDLCVSLGADAADMVPFEKYAAAAQSLGSPSSAARALASGGKNIERVDRLIQIIGTTKGRRNATVDETVSVINGWLAHNRQSAA